MFSGSGLFVSVDVVRYGVDGQGFRVKFCSDVVDISCFYFYVENVVFFYYVEYFVVWRVEQVSGEQVIYVSINIQCFSCIYCVMYYVEVSDSGKVMVFKMDVVNFGIGVGIYIDNDVVQFYVWQNCVIGIYVDNFFYVEIGDQFFGVDGVGWDIYIVIYYGNFVVFVSIGEVQYIVNVVYFMGIFKESFSNIFCMQWVVWY